MKKYFSLLLSAVLLMVMTGCFDITEEVTLKKDGSGQYSSIMDASKFAEQMQLFAAMDTTGEMIPKLKYSLDSAFTTTWASYSTLKGVKNVKIDTSKEYVYKVTFDFDNISALNSALNKDKNAGQENIYAWEKGKLSRKDMPLNLNDLKTDDEQQKEMMKTFLKDMKYMVIFHLPNDVKNVSNKVAKISTDRKTVTFESNLLDVTEGTVKLSNEVTYK
jgi:hypothetical protein